ncbi:MAG: ROK family protein [Candidatus Omnitrophica bacterium]|nr:ROK family protein [Candidatus Omnitrophota bacterium]
MAKSKSIIGVDIGATFVKIGLVDAKGKILHKDSFATKKHKNRDKLLSEIVDRVDRLALGNRSNIAGVGVGVPGPVLFKKGIVYNLTNIKGWKRVPLKSILSKRLKGMPIVVDNDANCACLGEALWGAAKGYRDIVCITLGSGVGGGIMIDGRVYRGRNYSAAEIGHICIDRNGPRCNCGSNGCFETFGGNNYIVKEVVSRLNKGERSSVLELAGNKYTNITPKLLDKAARQGDKFSIKAWEKVGLNIGIGLAGIVNVLNPEIIVIGGGLSKAGEHLFGSIRETVKARAMDIFTKGLKIKRAKFIEDAGIVGAAALIRGRLQ